MKNTLKTTFLTLMIVTLFVSLNFKEQIVKTQLKVVVLDDVGNLVEGASVQLYTSQENFDKETNPVTEKLTTDAKGIVKFDELESRVYYILVQKGDMNNWNGGIMTDKLQPKRVNKINVVIE